VRFRDSSALVPLLAEEPKTEPARVLYLSDPEVAVWWATPVECASAVARLEREGALPSAAAAESFKRLDALARSWIEVEPVDEIRVTARRRAPGIPVAGRGRPATGGGGDRRRETAADPLVVTLDQRLREAAEKEGFSAAEL
jgi:predicted nucleic acid-binding protein